MNAAAWNIEIDCASSHGVGVSNRLAQGTRAGVVGVYDSKNKRRRRLMRFRWVPRDCGVWLLSRFEHLWGGRNALFATH